MKKKFELGRLVMTCGVAYKMSVDEKFVDFVDASLDKYVQCDWGETCDEDKLANDKALRVYSHYDTVQRLVKLKSSKKSYVHIEKDGERLLAEYRNGKYRIWIITEWGGSVNGVTTVLFPEEY